MAGFKESLRGFVGDSMDDRVIRGESAPAGRSSLQRQQDGRRKLDGASEIRLDRIVRDPDQPRTEFDPKDLRQLAESIRARGVMTPIRVRWDDAADRYVVVLGERRFRASGLAGLETIPAVVTTAPISPEDLLEDQLVENALRSDLKPIEQAHAYRRLIESRGYTQRQLAERIHVSQPSIARALALLGLDAAIQEQVNDGRIAPDVGYQIARVEDPAERASLAREAEAGNLRRDDLRERSAAPRKGRGGKAGPPKPRTFRLSGAKVTVELKRAADDGEIADLLLAIVGQLRGASGREDAA